MFSVVEFLNTRCKLPFYAVICTFNVLMIVSFTGIYDAGVCKKRCGNNEMLN